jgi:hypothetical protein
MSNPTAIIISKSSEYDSLINTLSRKLAEDGCTVSTHKKLNNDYYDYTIFFGIPSSKGIKKLAENTRKAIVATKGKGEKLNIPLFFLPDNFEKNAKSISKDILEVLFTQPDLINTQPATPPPKRMPRIIPKKNLVEVKPNVSLSLLPLLILAALILYPAILIYSAKSNAKNTLVHFRQADFAEAGKSSVKTKQDINRLQRIYGTLSPIIKSLASGEDRDIKLILDTGESATELINTASETGARGRTFAVEILTHKPVAVTNETAYFTEQVNSILDRTTKLNTQLDSIANSNSLISRLAQTSIDRYVPELKDTEATIEKTRQIIPLLPELLGADSRKKYLVLFQNNMELRPTGGFIGSVGFLRFENGKMLELTVEDVYSLDGQLEGQITPPEPIEKYLGEENWYLRDANWDPDFAESADRIEWFLSKEVQTRVDGIVAVDLEFARKLLAALGGINLPDFNTVINADNLYLEAQTRSERDFFPGATNKRDFLGSLARALLIKISTESSLPVGNMLKEIFSSLSEKHILLNSNNEEVQKVFDKLGWSGRLLQPECKDEKEYIPDYLMVVESNLGVNKTNFFVQRLSKLDVSIEKNRLSRNLQIEYTNDSKQNSDSPFSGGDYKNYLRILIPPDAVLETIKINNKRLNLANVDHEALGVYRSLGFLVNIPAEQKRIVDVSYSSPVGINSNSFYELLVQKQPGLNNPSLLLNIDSTIGSSLDPINFVPIANNESLIYNTTLNTDKIFKVKIL